MYANYVTRRTGALMSWWRTAARDIHGIIIPIIYQRFITVMQVHRISIFVSSCRNILLACLISPGFLHKWQCTTILNVWWVKCQNGLCVDWTKLFCCCWLFIISMSFSRAVTWLHCQVQKKLITYTKWAENDDERENWGNFWHAHRIS